LREFQLSSLALENSEGLKGNVKLLLMELGLRMVPFRKLPTLMM
jgi:hypothetical protein